MSADGAQPSDPQVLAVALHGRVVRARHGTWTLRILQSRVERHGFVELTAVVDGQPSYELTLCVSEVLRMDTYGGRVEWILEGIREWLERPGAFDGEVLDFV